MVKRISCRVNYMIDRSYKWTTKKIEIEENNHQVKYIKLIDHEKTVVETRKTYMDIHESTTGTDISRKLEVNHWLDRIANRNDFE